MRNFALPDSTQITVTVSDSRTGPERTGQRVGIAIWYKIGNGEWSMSNFRTLHRFYDWLEICESVADFFDSENLADVMRR
jgi:hypothetical protein